MLKGAVGRRNEYETSNVMQPVYIFSGSCAFRARPQYVVYIGLQHPTTGLDDNSDEDKQPRITMRNVTAVEPSLLTSAAPQLCSNMRPLSAHYDVKADEMFCRYVVTVVFFG